MTKQLEQIHAEMERIKQECAELAITLKVLKQERDDLKRFAYEDAPRIAAEEANKQIDPLKEEIERLRGELENIANTSSNDDLVSLKKFREWTRNRARHALNYQPGALTIKR